MRHARASAHGNAPPGGAAPPMDRGDPPWRAGDGAVPHPRRWRRPTGGGESGIRTHGRFDPSAVFKTAALNHSAISPRQEQSASVFADLGAPFKRKIAGSAYMPVAGRGFRPALTRQKTRPERAIRFPKAPFFRLVWPHYSLDQALCYGTDSAR